MMRFNTGYYAAFGLKNFADIEQVKHAHRELAKGHHPDRGGDPEIMKSINAIYDVLTKRKDVYDAWLREHLATKMRIEVVFDWGGGGFNSSNSTAASAYWGSYV